MYLKLISVFVISCVTKFAVSECDNLIRRFDKEGIKHNCRKYYNGELSNCNSKKFPAGTVIEYQCDKYYVPQGDRKPNFGLNYVQCISSYWSGLGSYNQFVCSIDCGISADVKPHIIRGFQINPVRWPWHVSIFAKEKPDSPFSYICGGTLIKPLEKEFVIVTAAHCFSENHGKNLVRDLKLFKIILGGNSSIYEDVLASPFAQEYNVKRVKFHDSYQDTIYQSDIALALLDRPIELSPSILPVCLGQPFTQVKKPKEGFVVGFGRNDNNNSAISLHLREASLPVVESEKCNMWRGAKLQQSEICAGFEEGISTCSGDSGGSYVFKEYQSDAERYILEGIVSHGRSGPDSVRPLCDHYSVFTRVASYIPWIYRVAEDLIRGDTFDCCWLKKQGVSTTGKHDIRVNNIEVEVLCDMETEGGGWTVIQHRSLQGPSVNFHRNWKEYEAGFGTPPYSYWLGLLHISELTKNRDQLMRISIESFNTTKGKSYAEYDLFHVAGPSEKYKLEIGSYSGTAGDSMVSISEGWSSNGQYFSTYDNDNDGWGTGNCASDRHGSWWYWGCNVANPNGIHHPKETDDWQSVFWYNWGPIYSLKSMKIAIRNKNPKLCGLHSP